MQKNAKTIVFYCSLCSRVLPSVAQKTMEVTAHTRATITWTSACRAARCGRRVMWVLTLLQNMASISLGARPRRRPPITGVPMYIATVTTINSPSIVPNRISAIKASLMT